MFTEVVGEKAGKPDKSNSMEDTHITDSPTSAPFRLDTGADPPTHTYMKGRRPCLVFGEPETAGGKRGGEGGVRKPMTGVVRAAALAAVDAVSGRAEEVIEGSRLALGGGRRS